MVGRPHKIETSAMSLTSVPVNALPITRVHVVSKTHLDLGFTRQAVGVVEEYLDLHIPRVIAVNRLLRDAGRTERLTWTLGSWMVHEYLERADARRRREFEDAIANEFVVWHALPFTVQTEFMTASLLRGALGLSKRLDTWFGRDTIAGKMSDVPGHTRAMVPLLAEADVEFLHVGVNSAINMPQVPPLFVWRDDASSTQVTVMYHPAYGGFYAPPGASDALAVVTTADNEGPPSMQGVIGNLRRLSRDYPSADTNASTLDAFARAIRPITSTLPVVREEIGDTWIYGIGSHPAKVRGYLALSRWYEAHETAAPEQEMRAFVRRLICVPEHTWGLDTILMPAGASLEQASFLADRAAGRYAMLERSWAEQEDYLGEAVKVLPTSELRHSAREALKQGPCTEIRSADSLANLDMAIDTASGALMRCVETDSEFSLLASPIGLIRYQSYGERAYANYLSRYVRQDWQKEWWVGPALGKPGLAAIHPWELREWLPTVVDIRNISTPAGDGLEVAVEFDIDDPDIAAGAPKGIRIRYIYQVSARQLHVEIFWPEKQPTRFPEAMWCGFEAPHSMASCHVTKLGRQVSVHDVVLGGSRTTHAIDGELRWSLPDGSRFEIASPDTPLVCIGEPRFLTDNAFAPSLGAAAHFNLFNNLWGTNYPQWVVGAGHHRFRATNLPAAS
jgi:hypothetical protein